MPKLVIGSQKEMSLNRLYSTSSSRNTVVKDVLTIRRNLINFKKTLSLSPLLVRRLQLS